MRDTIDMAREAGWKDLRDYDSEMRNDFFMGNTDSLKAFEALVRADERNRIWTQEHWTEYERSIAAAEREACAEVCKKHADVYAGLEQNPTAKSAWAACIDNRDAIRARSKD
jgi:hypothetical protein